MKSGYEDEKDWDTALDMMLREMEEYESFIRGRMAMIDEADFSGEENIGINPPVDNPEAAPPDEDNAAPPVEESEDPPPAEENGGESSGSGDE